jgi:ATP-dependent Clp protease protease subunit
MTGPYRTPYGTTSEPPREPPEQPPQQWPGDRFGDQLLARLLDQRIVLVHGPLGAQRSTELAAALLTLDAESNESITVRLDSSGGDLGAALMLADTIDLMRGPVQVTCVGEVGGAAVAVVTAADRRHATPNARFHLVEPRVAVAELHGTADQIATVAAQQEAMLQRLCARIAAVTGHDASAVREQLCSPGRLLSAQEAVEYGLVERIDVPLHPRR